MGLNDAVAKSVDLGLAAQDPQTLDGLFEVAGDESSVVLGIESQLLIKAPGVLVIARLELSLSLGTRIRGERFGLPSENNGPARQNSD
jgi:hypothetical protein